MPSRLTNRIVMMGKKTTKKTYKKSAPKKKAIKKAIKKISRKKNIKKKAVKKTTKKKKEKGRPTDYVPEYNNVAYKLCLLNATDKQIADFFNICEQTLTNWKKEYPDFLGSITKGKITADTTAAESLFNRVTGYEYTEEKAFVVDGEIIKVELKKKMHPDVAAAFIWLKNRQSKLWRDRKQLEHSGNDGGPIEIKDYSKLTEEEAKKLFFEKQAEIEKE